MLLKQAFCEAKGGKKQQANKNQLEIYYLKYFFK